MRASLDRTPVPGGTQRGITQRTRAVYHRSVTMLRMIAAALVVAACSAHRGPEVEASEPVPGQITPPTPAVPTGGELDAIAAGVHHTCALRGDDAAPVEVRW